MIQAITTYVFTVFAVASAIASEVAAPIKEDRVDACFNDLCNILNFTICLRLFTSSTFNQLNQLQVSLTSVSWFLVAAINNFLSQIIGHPLLVHQKFAILL